MKTFETKTETISKTVTTGVWCNCCGHCFTDDDMVYESYVDLSFTWGYGSPKDGDHDSLHLCEACYDKWVATFKIPVTRVSREW